MEEYKILDALKKLREEESNKKNKVNFDQTIDLIVNLKEFDVRKHSFTVYVQLSKNIKNKKIAGFFEKDSKIIKVIKKEDFGKYKERKDTRKLVKSYDSFAANAKLMPSVATSFGRFLGPAGKMPSPQLGIVSNEDENTIKDLVNKINSTVRISVKEPSIKAGIGKASNDDKDIVKNVISVYNKITESLPKGKDNLRNVQIKFTMGKPKIIEL